MTARASYAASLACALLSTLVLGFRPASAGCPDLPRAVGAEPARSLVLVVADTLRRDRPGVYGGSASTPHFDAFAASHWLFQQASSQAPWTKPSVATLFTSLYPSQHRVASDPQLQGAFGVSRSTSVTSADVLGESFTTLAEVMQAAGARTAALVSNPWMVSRYGFGQGFEHYDDSVADWNAPGSVVSAAALAWLGEVPEGERYFLYVHYLDPHRPYGRVPVEEARAVEKDARALDAKGEWFVRNHLKLAGDLTTEEAGVEPSAALLERAYDLGVESFDAAFGALLSGLSARPDWHETALLVTSDHGEGLYERGYGNHGGGLFEEELAIPLALRVPGERSRGVRTDCLVGLVDVMPTLCDVMGASCPAGLAGRSWFDGEAAPEALVSEGVMTRPSNRAIRDRDYKLLYEPEGRRDGRADAGPTSLYRLDAGAEAAPDLVAEGPTVRRERAVLERAMAAAIPPWVAPPPETAPIDANMRERLEALGYTDDGAAGGTER